MSWSISFSGTPDELINKIDSDPAFPLSEQNAPDYAKNRFAELRETCRQIALLGIGEKKSRISLSGGGHTNGTVAEGGDGQESGSLSWNFGIALDQ